MSTEKDTEKEKLQAKLVDLTIRLNKRADNNFRRKLSLQKRIDVVKTKLARLDAGMPSEDEPTKKPEKGGIGISFSGGMGVPKIG